jgi:tetratricopeptide (TPR) repeat protein
MPRVPSPRALARLPQAFETWQIAIAQLRTWIAPPNEAPRRPFAIFIFNNADGAMLRLDLAEDKPAPNRVRDTLFETMAKPNREAGPPRPRSADDPSRALRGPRRPSTIVVPEPDQAEAIVSALATAQIEMDVIEAPPPPEFQDIVRELESHLREGEPEHPGLLSVKGVTPELAGSVFAAAAEFYRAAPWVRLTNLQAIAVRHPAEPDYRYAVVMGNGGVEYGLAVYLRWADLEQTHTGGVDNPMDAIPDVGAHSVFYDAITRLAFDDVEAIQNYGWEVASDEAYPIPVIFDKVSGARRPALIDMLWYEAALRAIPILVRDHLKPDGRGDYLPIETAIEVPTHAGLIEVDVKYPAGELSPAARAARDVDWSVFDEDEDGEEDLDAPLVIDRRMMEGMMAQLSRQMGGAEASANPQLDRAQELMYRAWEETNPAKRIALAHQALSISADCADAYVLLAEEEADTVGRALDYYQQGVSAGERALGPDYFREFAGEFWLLMETRPYLRARKGLADTLWQMNRRDEAIEHYREILRLNENDNQGVRYLLADLLLHLDRDDEVASLLNAKPYRDDWSATWLYTRALVEFRKGGASARAKKALGNALEENPHVPAYLAGRKRIPRDLPGLVGWGDEREAIAYAADHLNHWRRTPGAIEWLIVHMKAQPAPARKSAQARTSQAKKGSAAKGKRKPGKRT